MTGILLIQLGTPDAPTAGGPQALPPPVPLRPARHRGPGLEVEAASSTSSSSATGRRESAAKYARIWDPNTGSPLLHYTKRQTELLQQQFPDVPVRFGMQVGNPPLAPRRARDDRGGRRSARSRCRCSRSTRPPPPPAPPTSLFKALDDGAPRAGACASCRRTTTTRPISTRSRPSSATTSRSCRGSRSTSSSASTASRRSTSRSGDPYPTHVDRTTRGAGRSGWLAARAVDADVPVALRPRGVAQAVHRRRADGTGEEGREARLRRAARASPPTAWRRSTRSAARAARSSSTPAANTCRTGTCLNDHPKWIEAMNRIVVASRGRGGSRTHD